MRSSSCGRAGWDPCARRRALGQAAGAASGMDAPPPPRRRGHREDRERAGPRCSTPLIRRRLDLAGGPVHLPDRAIHRSIGPSGAKRRHARPASSSAGSRRPLPDGTSARTQAFVACPLRSRSLNRRPHCRFECGMENLGSNEGRRRTVSFLARDGARRGCPSGDAAGDTIRQATVPPRRGLLLLHRPTVAFAPPRPERREAQPHRRVRTSRCRSAMPPQTGRGGTGAMRSMPAIASMPLRGDARRHSRPRRVVP